MKKRHSYLYSLLTKKTRTHMKHIFLLLAVTVLLFNTGCTKIQGCTDPTAANFNTAAEKDNGTCTYNGKVVFWNNADWGTVTVTVNGQTQSITYYYPTYNPDCNSSGCAVFSLPVGSYSFTAHNTLSTATWSGSFSTTKNGCLKYLLQ